MDLKVIGGFLGALETDRGYNVCKFRHYILKDILPFEAPVLDGITENRKVYSVLKVSLTITSSGPYLLCPFLPFLLLLLHINYFFFLFFFLTSINSLDSDAFFSDICYEGTDGRLRALSNTVRTIAHKVRSYSYTNHMYNVIVYLLACSSHGKS